MNVALVGATGVVGKRILEQFTSRSFPLGELRLFASSVSAGEFVDFGDDSLPIAPLCDDAFNGIDLVIFATPPEVSNLWTQKAVEAGATCLDLSAAYRTDAARPLLVAGVNDAQLVGTQFSTPASLTAQLALLAGALREVAALRSLLVTAVSPASAQGKQGLDELQKQTGELLNGRPVQNRVFPAQLAFNCLPSSDGEREEFLAAELRKVLDAEDLILHINHLQVPLFYGEGCFVRVEFTAPVSAERLQATLAAATGIDLRTQAELPTLLDAIGAEDLLVQLCAPLSGDGTTFDFWCAADNVGSCTAGNVVRLAERIRTRIGSQQDD